MLFQKDYWQMTDERLRGLATKYNVYAGKLAYAETGGGPQTKMDRGKVVDALLARDAALRANVSVIAAAITILSTIINVVWTIWHTK